MSSRLIPSSISIHAAREGGDDEVHLWVGAQRISIHAAREGGDAITAFMLFSVCVFQSTPPVKAATHYINPALTNATISIHAAREGGDILTSGSPASDVKNFNPRRP